jgi:hypothetical protein
MATKLHELLAVETNLEAQAAKNRGDLAATFDKKRHLFEEKRIVFSPNGEGAQATVENQSDIQSTVAKELAWIAPFIAKSLDASFQVAEANTRARADIVLDDDANTVLLTGLPATALLELEKRVAEVATLVNAIPTLDPAKGFRPDGERGEGISQARPVVKTRTKKAKKLYVKYEATKEHPAQTELIDEDQPVGTIQEQEWSGLITPARKSELLAKVDTLARAVRRARSRANEVDVDLTKRIGKKLLDFVFAG